MEQQEIQNELREQSNIINALNKKIDTNALSDFKIPLRERNMLEEDIDEKSQIISSLSRRIDTLSQAGHKKSSDDRPKGFIGRIWKYLNRTVIIVNFRRVPRLFRAKYVK